MSNKKEREKRREERIAAESKASGSDQRTRILQLAAGAVFLAIVVVVVLVVANSSSSSSGGDASNLVEIKQVDSLVNGIPQSNMLLGDPKAPVQLIEYGDLQCPFCKAYSEEILPSIIENQVKKGEANITFRNYTIIGEQSPAAGAATLAAGKQGRGWYYLELFYRNQGEENSGYVTDEFMESIAKGAGVKNLAQWNKERESKPIKEEVTKTTEEAEGFGFTGTPSFAIKGPSTEGLELLGPSQTGSTEALEESISKAS
jgi:protein-disulfide isomerase